MKINPILFLILSFLLLSCHTFARQINTSAGVKKMGNQIRQFWFVMLTAGNNRNQDSVTAAKIQEGHLAIIKRLYNSGTLKVTGFFGDKGPWIGIFIFDCAGKEEVEQLLKTDPAVSSGRLAYEIHPWRTASIGNFESGKPKVPFE